MRGILGGVTSPHQILPLEDLRVVPAEVLPVRVELFVDRQPHRLRIEVLEQFTRRASR